jgi:hypothetical protein
VGYTSEARRLQLQSWPLLPKAHGEFRWKRYALFKQRFSKPSTILSGDGIDEETERVAVALSVVRSKCINWICQVSLVYVFGILLPALYHSNDALPSPHQVTLVGLSFACKWASQCARPVQPWKPRLLTDSYISSMGGGCVT